LIDDTNQQTGAKQTTIFINLHRYVVSLKK